MRRRNGLFSAGAENKAGTKGVLHMLASWFLRRKPAHLKLGFSRAGEGHPEQFQEGFILSGMGN